MAPGKFIGLLFQSRDAMHLAHLQTTSYAEHKALDKYQDEIAELYDGLVESVSGIYGRPKNYSVGTLQNYVSNEVVRTYFKDLYVLIEKERKTIYQETWVQNQIDEIAQLIAKTLYLLTLK